MSKPKLRQGKLGDVWEISDMIREGHANSRYAGFCALDPQRARALVSGAINRQGAGKVGDYFVAVADTGEAALPPSRGTRLEGFIIGLLQPLYHVLEGIEATDLFWYARPGAHGRTAGRLLTAFHKWVPAGALIRQGTSDAITDSKLSGRMLERRGLAFTGGIYEMEKSK